MIEKNIKTSSVLIRATPLMETLTGIMIAGFIAFQGNLLLLVIRVNNFFSFYSNDVSLSTNSFFSDNKHGCHQGATAFKRIVR